MTPTDVLRQYAHYVAVSAPKEWADFVQCFDHFTNATVTATVSMPADGVLVQQGKAQACLILLDIFKNHAKAPPPQNPPGAP